MVAEQQFPNAFAADGIIPDEYGCRTVVEYRSTLYTVPSSKVSNLIQQQQDDDMEIMPNHRNDLQSKSNSQTQHLSQAEDILKYLVTVLDMTGMGSFDPRYFNILSLPPPMYLSTSKNSILVHQTSATIQQQQQQQQASSFSIFSAMQNTFNKLMNSSSSSERFDPHPSLISWHGAENLIAIASGANLDRIFAYNLNTSNPETSGERIPILAATRCIAFRPYSGRFLAIGCAAGIVLMKGMKLHLLKYEGHNDIVSLDWSPDGSKLASASASDGTVRLWDIGTEQSIFVDRGSTVKFCPTIERRLLFISSATSPHFRLWSYDTWVFERWGNLSGPVVATTWSSDGSTLLFSTKGESAIHVISIGFGADDDSSRVIHTEVTSLPLQGPGGTPMAVELDATGERLAVSYQVPSNEENLDDEIENGFLEDRYRRYAVALYSTQLHPLFKMSPIGYINGPPESGPPITLKFKPKVFRNIGAILSCMWRSGQVTFTQLIFSPSRS